MPGHLSTRTSVHPDKRVTRTYVHPDKNARAIRYPAIKSPGLCRRTRNGYDRKPYCPVCPQLHTNNGIHLLFLCSSLSKLRVETGISSFITACSVLGIALDEAYAMFITGYDTKKKTISRATFFERAKCMYDMRQLWLSKW